MKHFLAVGGILALALAGCGTSSQNKVAASNTAGSIIVSPALKPAGSSAAAAPPTTKLQFSTQPASLAAGKTANWTLKIVDEKSGAPINDFEIAHDKLLHLVVVSKDLSWFSHLHPAYKGNGIFQIEATVPRAGEYKLFADFKPKDRAPEVVPHSFTVTGANPLPAQAKLIPARLEGVWMTTTAQAHEEGAAPLPGATKYQVALMPMPSSLVAGTPMMLHFQVRDEKGRPVKNLQPYLGAKGHLVVLSADASTYLHAHPMSGEGDLESMGHESMGHESMGHESMGHESMGHDESMGHEHHEESTAAGGSSDVMFHTEFPRAGLYKAWAQFRHNDKIITAPFVLQVKGAAQASTAIPPNAQRVTVELPEGYKNKAATVKAGTPVALTFKLKSEAGCGDEVMVPAANWRTKLKVGQSATVVYTPGQSGQLKFACTENMYKGSIVVQ